MDNAVYVSLSRQMTLQREMDVTANNLANIDTAGFKVDAMVLNTDPINAPANDNPTVQYVVDAQMTRDFGEGPLQQTSNPYDLAVEGDSFFSLQTAAGVVYTRDGRFTTDPTGQLTDQQGHAVLDATGRPIVLRPKASPPVIGGDGTVTQDGQPVGKIAIFRFPTRSALSKVGTNAYQNTSPTNAPVVATDATVRQGMIEESNVKPILEVTNLIQISRAYERIASIMNSATDLSKSAVDRLGKSA